MDPIDLAAAFNRDCHCMAVDRDSLDAELAADLEDRELARALRSTHRDLFASFPVFLSKRHLAAMRRVVAAVEAATRTAGFRDAVAERSGHRRPEWCSPPLLGFDFHLPDEPSASPQLIEINTNPGGVLLALYAARAQRACCAEVEEMQTGGPRGAVVEAALAGMVREAAGAADGRPLVAAIVDEDPASQFLYPELLLYRRLFARHDIDAGIADPSALQPHGGRLVLDGRPLDVVYNRLTDFALEQPQCVALGEAWRSGRLGLTPSPWDHALYADKRNFAALSDADRLRRWNLPEETIAALVASVPGTQEVAPERAAELWEQRRSLFFKPATGYGSRGAYDGAKLTRKTFEQILASRYVAQRRVAPSERVLVIDGERRPLKVDLRCVTWKEDVLMVLARLYRGQTTNLRTEGGGLATVFLVEP
ncbi:MAG TPA: hypothetical protein VMV46_11950 [Thermoanaerobaculia bacterium]|nr:hypothetical protein [Thermoanaerobaculia bacterium]